MLCKLILFNDRQISARISTAVKIPLATGMQHLFDHCSVIQHNSYISITFKYHLPFEWLINVVYHNGHVNMTRDISK